MDSFPKFLLRKGQSTHSRFCSTHTPKNEFSPPTGARPEFERHTSLTDDTSGCGHQRASAARCLPQHSARTRYYLLSVSHERTLLNLRGSEASCRAVGGGGPQDGRENYALQLCALVRDAVCWRLDILSHTQAGPRIWASKFPVERLRLVWRSGRYVRPGLGARPWHTRHGLRCSGEI